MIGIIKYGEIQLELVKVNNEHHRPIMSADGVSYLYTEITLDLNCMYSPEATSYRLSSGNAIPQAGNAHAAETNRALLMYLSQPFRVLKMFTFNTNGEQVITLQSPPTIGGVVQKMDCLKGPLCEVFSIAETFGVKSYTVHLQFKTWVQFANYEKDSPIIDNRWETYVDIDQDYFQTITRRGTTTFNAGRLFTAGLSPDHFREQLFQAPAPNFKRSHVNVTVASDCSRADWTVVDTELPFNLGTGSPATRIEAMLTTWVKHGSLANAVAAAAPQMNNNASLSMGDIAWSLVPGIGPQLAFANWSARQVDGTISAVGGNLVSQLPQMYASITVRAHGGRTSTRADLATLCWAITHSWLGKPTFFTLGTSTELIMTQDVAGKFVELRCTMRWSQSVIVQLAGLFGAVPALGVTWGSTLAINSQAMNFLSQFYVNRDGTAFTENDIHIDNNQNLNLTQTAISNRPMNTGQTTTGIPPGPIELPNPNSPYRHSRSPGDLQYMLTAVLRGEPNIPASPGPWEGLPLTPVPADGIFHVPSGVIPILPRA